jgi:hypothetical protein
MAEKKYGKITVRGTPLQIALADKAYGGQVQPVHIEDMLAEEYVIEFHTAAEFRKQKYLLPDGSVAWGHVVKNNYLWVNSDIRPRYQTYALRHEPFHPYVTANMTASKRIAINAMVKKVSNGTAYQNRLNEVLCDCGVEFWWGQGSVNDSYYGDIPDELIDDAFAILAEPSAEPPLPPTATKPEDLPIQDPRMVAMQAELDQWHNWYANAPKV